MKQYFTLKNYTISMAIVFVVMVTVHNISQMPKTITISADRWKCVDTMPDGIEARCTTLTYIPTISEKLAMKTP